MLINLNLIYSMLKYILTIIGILFPNSNCNSSKNIN